MTDREKIIRAIEKAKKQSAEYAQDRIIVPFKETDMILALLKEQEAVQPKEIAYAWRCGKCDEYLTAIENHRIRFCPYCGKAVKWE